MRGYVNLHINSDHMSVAIFPLNRINNFTTMAPGQVQLSAFANVTLSFSLKLFYKK